jgi:hypothetical protein
MQMRLTILLRISYPLLKYRLRFLDKLSVKINGIVRNPSHRVVLPENVVGRLFIVRVHIRRMLLPFLTQLVRRSSITSLVCLVRLQFQKSTSSSPAIGSETWGTKLKRTLSKHADRFAASCRARSRSLSYSASAL